MRKQANQEPKRKNKNKKIKKGKKKSSKSSRTRVASNNAPPMKTLVGFTPRPTRPAQDLRCLSRLSQLHLERFRWSPVAALALTSYIQVTSRALRQVPVASRFPRKGRHFGGWMCLRWLSRSHRVLLHLLISQDCYCFSTSQQSSTN